MGSCTCNHSHEGITLYSPDFRTTVTADQQLVAPGSPLKKKCLQTQVSHGRAAAMGTLWSH